MVANKSLKVSGLIQRGKLVIAAPEKVAHMPDFPDHSAQHEQEAKYDRLLEANQNLQNKLDALPPRELPIDQLHEVADRKRRLTEEQFNELVENLRNNALVTAITVRRRATGGYEIISGHNRVAAYRELGKDSILAIVIDSDDENAKISSFYANLLHPNLPDLEIYEGYKKILEMRPGTTHEELAKGSGKSRQLVSQIMAYEDMPTESLECLKKANRSLGSTTVQSLAALKAKGAAPRLSEAIEKFAAGEITQDQAVKFAASNGKSTSKEKIAPIRIMSGKTKYCEIRRLNTSLRFDFKNEQEAEAALEEIQAILQNRARQS